MLSPLVIPLLISAVSSVGLQPEPERPTCRIPPSFERQFDCFHFIVDTARTTKQDCLLFSFDSAKSSTFIVAGYKKLLSQNLRGTPPKFNCRTYVILIKDVVQFETLLSNREQHRRFRSTTNILFVLDFADDDYEKFEPSRKILEFIVRFSLNVLWTKYKYFVVSPLGERLMVFRQPLSNSTIVLRRSDPLELRQRIKFFDEDLLVTRLLKNERKLMKLRVSMFQSPPLVVYPPREKFKKRFDGVEFRCVEDVAKNWQVEYLLRDRNLTINLTDPFSVVKADVTDDRSDIALISHWLTQANYRDWELSIPYDYQCATFLVPKPGLIAQGSYVYMAMGYEVWSAFAVSLISTALLLKGITFVGLKFYGDQYDRKFKSLITGFVESINIATSHGLTRIPSALSIRVLIMSWTYFVLLFGTGYSTGYTSLLTTPKFSKPIDTIADFIQQGIFWGEFGYRPGWLLEFNQTGDPNYIELGRRMLVEKDLKERYRNIETGKYARMVKVLSGTYLTDTETYPQYASQFRLMKQCTNYYFTTFVFQKQSQFSHIFNRQIARFKESGIHQKWFHDILNLYGYSQIMSNFFDNTVSRSTILAAITMSNLVGAFYLLFIGLALALVVFIVERCYK